MKVFLLTFCLLISSSFILSTEYNQTEFEKFLAENTSTYTVTLKQGDDTDSNSDSPTPSGSAAEKKSSFASLVDSFFKYSNQWTQVVQAFKTTRKSSTVETITGKGFNFFDESCQIQVTKGVKEEFISKFFEHMTVRLKVPDSRKADLVMVLEEALWSDSQAWNAFETAFSIDTQGTTKYANILVNKDDTTGKYNIVLSDIKAAFKFAPDVMVVRKELSVLGGIWEDDKVEYISKPKSITAEDMELVLGFFKMISFKNIGKQLGVEFPNY